MAGKLIVLGLQPVRVRDNDVLVVGKQKASAVLLTEVTVQEASETNLAASAEVDLDGVESLALTIKVVYHASATVGVVLKVWTSPTGSDYDSDAYTTFTPSFAANGTKQKTRTIDPSPGKLKVTVENLDSAEDAVVTVTAVYQ